MGGLGVANLRWLDLVWLGCLGQVVDRSMEEQSEGSVDIVWTRVSPKEMELRTV